MKIFKLNKYLHSNLIRSLSIVFSESILTKALSFVSILILSKTLGAEEYGKYSFIFVTVAFCSAFFDFGMENSAVRFSAREKEKNSSIFGLYLFVKLIISFFVILVMMIWGTQIFLLIGKSELAQFIPFLVIGFLGESFLLINDTFLQAIQKFKLRAIINISRYLILVSGIIILQLNDLVILKYVVFIYFLPILISLCFFLKYVEFLKSYFSFRLSKVLVKEIFSYQKWMLLISIPNNTLGRIDFFLISLWVTYEQIGIYNLAFQLSAIVSFIPFVFGKVMLPKLSELSQKEVVENTRKITRPVLLISAVMLCAVPLVQIIIPFLLDDTYLDSISILQVMLVSSIIAFAIVPIEQALYSLGKPQFITIGKYVQVVTIVLLIFLTVPYLGLIWAAISVLLARLIYGVILFKFYLNYTKAYCY